MELAVVVVAIAAVPAWSTEIATDLYRWMPDESVELEVGLMMQLAFDWWRNN